jgi:uncharacterized protein (DUF58 family)
MPFSVARYLGRPDVLAGDGVDVAELQAQVRRLEVRARQAMQAGIAGQYRSAFRGRGLELEEVREYRSGDDVRTIDWNVTARNEQLFVKVYREERDLTVLLLVDLSASTRFGSGVLTVHDLIAEVSSLFVLAGARRDRVGAVLFDAGVRRLIPPRRGWRHGLRIVREVLAAEPDGDGTAFAEALRTADRLLQRRGVVVAVVDGSCPMPRREMVATANRHDLVIVRAHDPLAAAGPESATVPARAAEGGQRFTFDRGIGEPAPVPAGIDVVELSTNREYLPQVRDMLERRERRRAR